MIARELSKVLLLITEICAWIQKHGLLEGHCYVTSVKEIKGRMEEEVDTHEQIPEGGKQPFVDDNRTFRSASMACPD